MRGVIQRFAVPAVFVAVASLGLIAPGAARAQAQIEPEAQVWVDRLVKQMTDLKAIWGRFELEENRNYTEPPTPPDPNKRVNVSRQPGWSVSEVFWVYDGFRERFDRKQIEPKEPLAGESFYDTRRFFNGELLVDQIGHSVALRDDKSVPDWTPRRFFLTVVNRPYTQAVREAKAIRAIDPEVKFGVKVAGFEIDLEKPGPFRIRVYLETKEPYFLRGHEEFREGKLQRTRWIDTYNPKARDAGLLCPQEAHIDTHYNNVRYTLRARESHVNDSVPEEHWQMRFGPGDYIVDEMTGNQWYDVQKLPADLDRRINRPVNLNMLRGESFEATPVGTTLPRARQNTMPLADPAPEGSGYGWLGITVISVATALGTFLVGFGVWSVLRASA